jgi:hypothetical protein
VLPRVIKYGFKTPLTALYRL